MVRIPKVKAGFMRLAVFIVAMTAGLAARADEGFPFDPLAVYGPQHRFTVLRDGTPIGSHEVIFSETEAGLAVTARSRMRIPFLFFTAYGFDYVSRALWREGRLAALEATTDDNGEAARVQVTRGPGGALVIHGPDGTARIEGGLYPTNHWHPGVLGAGRVLNTITGRVNDVTITRLGVEEVPSGDETIMATHYRYSGELENEVWYDDRGRWVRMRFRAEDGSWIEYRCETCGERAATEIANG